MYYVVDNLNIDHFDTDCKTSIKSVSNSHLFHHVINDVQPVFVVHNPSTSKFLSKLLNRYIAHNSHIVRPRPGDVIFYCKCLSDGTIFWRKVIVESNLEEYNHEILEDEEFKRLKSVAETLSNGIGGTCKLNQDYFGNLFFIVKGDGVYVSLKVV